MRALALRSERRYTNIVLVVTTQWSSEVYCITSCTLASQPPFANYSIYNFMLRFITRTTTPLLAFGLGFAAFPYRKSVRDTKLQHINEDIAQKILSSNQAQELINDPEWEQVISSNTFPHQHKKNYVSRGLLMGPNLFEIDPIIYMNSTKGEFVGFYHLGSKLVSQDGRVHNGVVATLLDEGLCACGFPRLPSTKGVTAQLALNFENEADPETTVVLRAKIIEARGRKVVSGGTLESFDPEGKTQPHVIASGKVVLVEPNWFKYFRWVQPV